MKHILRYFFTQGGRYAMDGETLMALAAVG